MEDLAARIRIALGQALRLQGSSIDSERIIRQMIRKEYDPAYLQEAAPVVPAERPAAAPTSFQRLETLVRRIYEWEDIEDEDSSFAIGEELLLDIKQCLESVIERDPTKTP